MGEVERVAAWVCAGEAVATGGDGRVRWAVWRCQLGWVSRLSWGGRVVVSGEVGGAKWALWIRRCGRLMRPFCRW